MKILASLTLVLACAICHGQKYLTVDLSARTSREMSIDLDVSGVVILNMCPERPYRIKVIREQIKDDNKTEGNNSDDLINKYDSFAKTFFKLKEQTAESKVKADISALENAWRSIPETTATMKEDKVKLVAIKNELINKTRDTIPFDFVLRKKQVIRVKVERLEGSDVKQTWENVYKTPAGVNYITHFGFSYGLNAFGTPTTYYAQKDANTTPGTPDSYTITPLNSNGRDFWKDLSLTANFIFPFKKKAVLKGKDPDYSLAWMAGFGVGGNTQFSVYTGPAVVLQDFFSVSLGVGVTNKSKLNGIYKAGQKVMENLNFDQLHSKGPLPEIMLTIGFRLSKKQLGGTEEVTL